MNQKKNVSISLWIAGVYFAIINVFYLADVIITNLMLNQPIIASFGENRKLDISAYLTILLIIIFGIIMCIVARKIYGEVEINTDLEIIKSDSNFRYLAIGIMLVASSIVNIAEFVFIRYAHIFIAQPSLLSDHKTLTVITLSLLLKIIELVLGLWFIFYSGKQRKTINNQ